MINHKRPFKRSNRPHHQSTPKPNHPIKSQKLKPIYKQNTAEKKKPSKMAKAAEKREAGKKPAKKKAA